MGDLQINETIHKLIRNTSEKIDGAKYALGKIRSAIDTQMEILQEKCDHAAALGVIDKYADGVDKLTDEECKGLGIPAPKCDTLRQVFQNNSNSSVSTYDEKLLHNAGFSAKFIKTLKGSDGFASTKARVNWLKENILSNDSCPHASSDDIMLMLSELASKGKFAEPALDNIIISANDCDKGIVLAAVSAIGYIAQEILDNCNKKSGNSKKCKTIKLKAVDALYNTAMNEKDPIILKNTLLSMERISDFNLNAAEKTMLGAVIYLWKNDATADGNAELLLKQWGILKK